MPFTLPDSPPSKSTIEELIQQSVFRFEAKLSQFGILQMAKLAGWVDDYRKELQGIAASRDPQIRNALEMALDKLQAMHRESGWNHSEFIAFSKMLLK